MTDTHVAAQKEARNVLNDTMTDTCGLGEWGVVGAGKVSS